MMGTIAALAKANVAQSISVSSKTVNVWFTADHHFGHRRIIEYAGRPYGSLDEMNDDLYRRWREAVAPDDIVYHLGDFCFGPAELWADALAALPGRKVLILGNHDKRPDRMRAIGFDDVHEEMYVTLGGKRLWLHHLPVVQVRGPTRPKPSEQYDMVCGHVHQHWRLEPDHGTINVGVDAWSLAPVSLADVLSTAARPGAPAS